jgi:hypothetical protein
MTKLFLDDVRMPPDQTWDIVRNYDAFVAYITAHGVPDIIAFDHDLSQEHYAALDKFGFPELDVYLCRVRGEDWLRLCQVSCRTR